MYVKFEQFYQDLYRILWKIPKKIDRSHFPKPPPPRLRTSAFEFDKPLPLLRTSLWTATMENVY